MRNPFAASASAVAKSSSESTGSAGASVNAAGGAFDWRGLGNALGFILIIDSGKTERQACALDHRLMDAAFGAGAISTARRRACTLSCTR